MALKKSITYKGILLENAYFKILETRATEAGKDDNGNKLYDSNITCVLYSDNNKIEPIDTVTTPTRRIKEEENTFSNSYTWLKTLPFFEGAEDC